MSNDNPTRTARLAKRWSETNVKDDEPFEEIERRLRTAFPDWTENEIMIGRITAAIIKNREDEYALSTIIRDAISELRVDDLTLGSDHLRLQRLRWSLEQVDRVARKEFRWDNFVFGWLSEQVVHQYGDVIHGSWFGWLPLGGGYALWVRRRPCGPGMSNYEEEWGVDPESFVVEKAKYENPTLQDPHGPPPARLGESR